MAQVFEYIDNCTVGGLIPIPAEITDIMMPCICVSASVNVGAVTINGVDREVITDCLEVSVAGAWGAIGDRITHSRIYNLTTGIPVLESEQFYNVETLSIVTGINSTNTQACTANGSQVASLIVLPRNQILNTSNTLWTSATADNPLKLRSVSVSVTKLGDPLLDGIVITDTQGNISTYRNLYLGWGWNIDSGNDAYLDTISIEVLGSTEASVNWTEQQ